MLGQVQSMTCFNQCSYLSSSKFSDSKFFCKTATKYFSTFSNCDFWNIKTRNCLGNQLVRILLLRLSHYYYQNHRVPCVEKNSSLKIRNILRTFQVKFLSSLDYIIGLRHWLFLGT